MQLYARLTACMMLSTVACAVTGTTYGWYCQMTREPVQYDDDDDDEDELDAFTGLRVGLIAGLAIGSLGCVALLR